MKIPGVGPVIATALVALAPSASTFRAGGTCNLRGLVPREHCSGKGGWRRTTKMGERSFRRLLTPGASSATQAAARIPTQTGIVGQHAVAQAAHAGHHCAGPSFSRLTF
jgi:transposase